MAWFLPKTLWFTLMDHDYVLYRPMRTPWIALLDLLTTLWLTLVKSWDDDTSHLSLEVILRPSACSGGPCSQADTRRLAAGSEAHTRHFRSDHMESYCHTEPRSSHAPRQSPEPASGGWSWPRHWGWASGWRRPAQWWSRTRGRRCRGAWNREN